MSITTPQAAERRRKEIADRLLAISGRSNPTQQDRVDFATLEREFNDLADLANDHSRRSVSPPNAPIGTEHDTASSNDRWIDTRTGKEVRLLAPHESFRSTPDPSHTPTRSEELGIGRLLRAIALGPKDENERRALAESTSGAGGWLLPVLIVEEVVDFLRSKTVTIQAGARTLKLENWATNVARLGSDLTPTWRAENAVITESTPVFEGIPFRAKSFGTYLKISRELWEDASNLDQLLKEVIGKTMALCLDKGVLYGQNPDESPVNGSEPLGVAYTTGVQNINLDAAITSYDPILAAEKALANANSPASTAVIMHPNVQYEFEYLKDTLHQPLRRPPSIENLPFLSTTAVPTDETTTSSPVLTGTSSILSGHWPNCWIGIRSELKIDTLRERYADYGQVALLCFMRADAQISQPASIVRTLGVQ
jgi:HK97 family phage major capsid protein